MKEREILNFLSSQFSSTRFESNKSSSILGIGDDAAIFESDLPIVVTTDAMSYSSHVFEWIPDRMVGKRFVTSNVSDLAAMGSLPSYFLNNILLNSEERDHKSKIIEILKGIRESCISYNIQILGGDISSALETILSGFAIGLAEHGFITRKGATSGDLLCVTGDLGRVKTGLELGSDLPDPIKEKLFNPRARVDEGIELANIATSCNDISDGLSIEAWEIAEASKVRVILDPEELPINKYVLEYSDEPIKTALSSGEEFELLFTMNPKDFERLNFNFTVIGEIKEGSGVYLKDGSKVERTGWQHFDERG